MVESSATSIFVPILVLVIIEISQAAREINLVSIAKQKQEPFFYTVFYLLDQSSQDLIRIPQLGPFNFIHGMNLAIIHLGFVLILLTSEGTVRLIVALIMWLFWVLFPILEVSEYVQIMSAPEIGPRSFFSHSVITTITALVVFAFKDYLINPMRVGGIKSETLLLVLGICLFYYANLIGFLSLLEQELEQC